MKKKTNQKQTNEKNRNRHKYRDLVTVKGKGMVGWTKQVKGIKRHKLPVIKLLSLRNEKYNIGNTVNNIVVTLHGDRQ